MQYLQLYPDFGQYFIVFFAGGSVSNNASTLPKNVKQDIGHFFTDICTTIYLQLVDYREQCWRIYGFLSLNVIFKGLLGENRY